MAIENTTQNRDIFTGMTFTGVADPTANRASDLFSVTSGAPGAVPYIPENTLRELNAILSPGEHFEGGEGASSPYFQNTTVYGPPTPSDLNPGSTTGTSNLSESLSNIVRTGSASGTPTPTAAPGQKMATLVNPTTGDRKAVAVDSQEAQALFGQGYTLEGAPGGGASATASASATTTPPAQFTSQVPGLREKAAKIKSDMFSAVYGYTPDEWQDLDPGTQRQLRNQRVLGLEAQLGNINAAITIAKEEEATARSQALETLNTYLKYGVLDKVSPDELSQLAGASGLNMDALNAMNSQAEPMELKEFNGNLYGITFDPDTGEPIMKLVMAGTTKGGGGGGGSSDFNKFTDQLRNLLLANELDWTTAFNTVKSSFPGQSNESINQALGGSIEYDYTTGQFGTATGLATRTGATGGITYDVNTGEIRIKE